MTSNVVSGREHRTSRIFAEQEAFSLSLSALVALAAAAVAWTLTRACTHGRLP